MDRNKELNEQIDRYLQAKMSEEERLAFEQKVQADPALASELQLQQDLAGGIRAYHNQKIKNKLDQIHDEIQPGAEAPTSINRRKWIYPLLAVAAIALLLLLVRQNWTGTNSSPEKLYAQFYQSHNLSLASRSADVDDQLLQIDALYKKGEYDAVIPYIDNKLTEIQGKDNLPEQVENAIPKLHLASGIAHLEVGQTQKAVDYFQRIVDANDPFLKDHALWYLALSRLRLNQTDVSRTLLLELTKNKRADHYQEAIQLLEAL